MADTKLKRHPVRGALYGLLLGLSAAYFAFFQFAMFGFDTLTGVIIKFGIIVLVGVVIGVVWAYVAPPKKGAPAGAPPAPPAAA
jgi:predicted exporter